MKISRVLTLICTFLCISAAFSAHADKHLTNTLDRLIQLHAPRANIAVYVKSMRHGDILYAHRIYQPLKPASTLKILTAEAALLFLGPSYRFETQLLTDARVIRGGVLQGNLYVILSGDPTFTYADLTNLLFALQTRAIRTITGNLYIDETAYDKQFYGPGWKWRDKHFCYAAPISASIINRNCPAFRVTPTSQSRSIAILNGGAVVNDVAEYNRFLFKTALRQLAIDLQGRILFQSVAANAMVLNTHYSAPLATLINEMLKKSDNVIAGAIFKKIGQSYTQQPGSWQTGRVAVTRILNKTSLINTKGIKILDGSGLSPHNLTSSAQLMQALDFAYHHQLLQQTLITSLPISGIDGTLKHRMHAIARKIRAKTGTIAGVVALAGFAESKNKEPLAFVIMINGYKGWGARYKALEDKIATALTKYQRTPPNAASSL